jgi:hypothetical protein
VGGGGFRGLDGGGHATALGVAELLAQPEELIAFFGAGMVEHRDTHLIELPQELRVVGVHPGHKLSLLAPARSGIGVGDDDRLRAGGR